MKDVLEQLGALGLSPDQNILVLVVATIATGALAAFAIRGVAVPVARVGGESISFGLKAGTWLLNLAGWALETLTAVGALLSMLVAPAVTEAGKALAGVVGLPRQAGRAAKTALGSLASPVSESPLGVGSMVTCIIGSIGLSSMGVYVLYRWLHEMLWWLQ